MALQLQFFYVHPLPSLRFLPEALLSKGPRQIQEWGGIEPGSPRFTSWATKYLTAALLQIQVFYVVQVAAEKLDFFKMK